MRFTPHVTVATIVENQGRFLMVEEMADDRAVFNQPAGHLEADESLIQAALRETLEEACARVAIDDLFALVNVPHINQVHLFYRGRLLDTDFAAGAESLETALFSEENIPWPELAFGSVARCLAAYFADRRAGRFRFHEDELSPDEGY